MTAAAFQPEIFVDLSTSQTRLLGTDRRPCANFRGRLIAGEGKVARAISAPRPGEDGSSRGMLLGYARVSTIDQNLALQRDALAEAA
jgi:hypothetical protein